MKVEKKSEIYEEKAKEEFLFLARYLFFKKVPHVMYFLRLIEVMCLYN